MPALTYKTAIITGGSLRIGGHLSRVLARNGWAIAIHYHGSEKEAEDLAREIRRDGGCAEVVCADLQDPESPSTLLEQATKAVGPIGALINNASVFEPELWQDVSEESWAAHINVNLRAPFFLSQAFARALPAKAHGAIVNIIDQRVLNLRPDYISYTVSKSGLWTLTQTLALAMAPRVRVNGVGPGPTLPNKRQTPKTFARQAASMPLKHGATPDDIANAVLYLLNAEAVTGQMIAVDGGEHLGWVQESLAEPIDE